MPFLAATDGTPIYYTDRGRGTPILFIHGWGASQEMFSRNLEPLSRTHRVIAVDLRGHGQSGKQSEVNTLPQAARDLRLLIDTLGLENVVAVGWSVGTSIIYTYLHLFGDHRLAAMVNIDMVPFFLRTDDWPHGLMGSLDYPGAIALTSNFLEDRAALEPGLAAASFRDGSAADLEGMDVRLRDMRLVPTPILVSYWISALSQDWRTLLPTLSLPALLAFGSRSATFPTAPAADVHRLLPHAELVLFEESGHAPFWEEAEIFNAVITRFAEQVSSGTGDSPAIGQESLEP